MKLLILSDIHAGNASKNSFLVSDTALESLENLIPSFKEGKFDLIFQLGDLVKESNPDNEVKIQSLLESIGPEVINTAGNHDLQSNFPSNNPQLKILDDFQLVTLGLDLDQEKNLGCLPKQDIDFLNELDSSKRTILFSHYGIFPPNREGNHYFDNPNSMHYFNDEEILEVLKNKNIILQISGHLHWVGVIERQFRQISAPSFSENIFKQEKNPGVFSTLETNDNKLTFKSWSQGQCFFDYEFNI